MKLLAPHLWDYYQIVSGRSKYLLGLNRLNCKYISYTIEFFEKKNSNNKVLTLYMICLALNRFHKLPTQHETS